MGQIIKGSALGTVGVDRFERNIYINLNLGLSYSRYYKSNFRASQFEINVVRCDLKTAIAGTGDVDIQIVDANNITTVYFEAIGLAPPGIIEETFNVPATATPFPTTDFDIAVYARYAGVPICNVITVYFDIKVI